jgi:uncharacterized protein (DUF924 family)
MTEDSVSLVRRLLEFWFGPHGDPERGSMRPVWFGKDPVFDAKIREQFYDDVLDAGRGRLDGLSGTADGVLALLILLDQFPRNLFRNEAQAYAYDGKARAVARLAIGMGLDKVLSPVERIFIYLPFEHSEDMEDQIRSVALFKTLPPVPWRDEVVDYAIRHHDIIARFGRFPHRNALLGRSSTAEELAFLQEPNSAF